MNSGAAPVADGAARRRLPIASLVADQQAPGAVALVTERAPSAVPTSLLSWTNLNSDQRLADVLLVPIYAPASAQTMTVPSSGGLAVRQQATRQQLKAMLVVPRTSSTPTTAFASPRRCRFQTKGVTTTALAPRARPDTNAGLGTADDVCLASRHQQGSRCDAEPGLGVRGHEQVHVMHGRRHGFVRWHGSYRPSSVRSPPSRVGRTLSMPVLHADDFMGAGNLESRPLPRRPERGVFCVCGRPPERPRWRAGSRPHARDETSMAAGDTHALGPARRARLSAVKDHGNSPGVITGIPHPAVGR